MHADRARVCERAAQYSEGILNEDTKMGSLYFGAFLASLVA